MNPKHIQFLKKKHSLNRPSYLLAYSLERLVKLAYFLSSHFPIIEHSFAYVLNIFLYIRQLLYFLNFSLRLSRFSNRYSECAINFTYR